MKYLCHVPIEQYGFISVEVEGTPEQAVQAYRDVLRANDIRTNGLPLKEWCAALDAYVSGKGMTSEVYSAMSDKQQLVIQELKKCFKRINK